MSEEASSSRKAKPWEKAWVNPKFVFKNPRCRKSKIPLAPTCAYDDAMNGESSDAEEASTDTPSVQLSDVAMPKPKVKQPRPKPHATRETLKEWKQRRRRFVKKEEPRDAIFPTRVGFAYSDLPMEPKREAERVLPGFPPGMTLAERRHWEAWSRN